MLLSKSARDIPPPGGGGGGAPCAAVVPPPPPNKFASRLGWLLWDDETCPPYSAPSRSASDRGGARRVGGAASCHPVPCCCCCCCACCRCICCSCILRSLISSLTSRFASARCTDSNTCRASASAASRRSREVRAAAASASAVRVVDLAADSARIASAVSTRGPGYRHPHSSISARGTKGMSGGASAGRKGKSRGKYPDVCHSIKSCFGNGPWQTPLGSLYIHGVS
mmetsp:Transcript_10557/g.34956  ORF Transcript_10557/g.34956 Transcript_10557/m.34956 type:complete len:226 (+) Transcript_10557:4189-4866(+)